MANLVGQNRLKLCWKRAEAIKTATGLIEKTAVDHAAQIVAESQALVDAALTGAE